MFFRSATASPTVSRGTVCFSTATDSPVSADSSICRFTASISLMSAGILLPVLSRITSPGTSSRAGVSTSTPFLNAVAEGAAIWRNASIARSDRYSCTKPSTTAKSTMTAIAIASISCPRKAERVVATSNMAISTFLNCCKNSRNGEMRSADCTSFGPCSAKRRDASAPVKPAGVEFRIKKTSSQDISCHWGFDSFAVESINHL